MIDHVSIAVADLGAASSFYDLVLEPLGLRRLVSQEKTVGFGKRYPELWLNARSEVYRSEDPGSHVCLRALAEENVRQFHALALASGGADCGSPGPRNAAMTTYVGAFILDLDGNKMEVASFPRP